MLIVIWAYAFLIVSQKGSKKNLGSFAWQVGDFMGIYNFHAQRGFAFVEEEALELTHIEKLKKEPPPPEAGDDRKAELVLSLLKHTFPHGGATEVTKCLHNTYVLENQGCGQDPRIVPKRVPSSS